MRIEPDSREVEEWASGLRDCMVPIAGQYVNWAYWYLGFDEQNFQHGDVVINEAICKLTEACRMRLRELADE